MLTTKVIPDFFYILSEAGQSRFVRQERSCHDVQAAKALFSTFVIVIVIGLFKHFFFDRNGIGFTQ